MSTLGRPLPGNRGTEVDDWSVQALRRRIDLLDSRILKLLEERMELGLRARRVKGSVRDEAREAQLLEGIRRQAQGLSRPEFAEQLFTQIMAESRALQEKDLALCGFQGEHGAYGEIAARRVAPPGAVALPCPEFADVFEGVRAGRLDLGVVPVENSLAGAVPTVNDLLVESDELSVVGEVYVPIRHCLLAPRETALADVRAVYSHPVALAQCRGFVARHRLDARAWYDTAGAARMLADERPEGAAAIASALCAELYDLAILEEDVEDHPSNHTRFLAIARQPAQGPGSKSSIAFTTAHRAGALFEVLEVFSRAGVNLTRIESRPWRGDFARFAFLLDLAGSPAQEPVAQALAQVERRVERYRFLGCYEGAPR